MVWSGGFMSHMRTDKVNGTRAQKWHRGDQREGEAARADPGGAHFGGEEKEEEQEEGAAAARGGDEDEPRGRL